MLGKQVEAFNSDEERRRQVFEAEWKQINERWVKAQNEKELQAQKAENESLKDLSLKQQEQIMNQQEQLSHKDEQIMNQQEQLFHKDEQITNQQEKLVSYAKLLKSLGKTTLEIKEATGLSADEIEKL